MDKLSIVVPVMNEEQAIDTFYESVTAIEKQVADISFEYWFVDDGSSDNTVAVIKELQHRAGDAVHYISFSRNFGKEAALLAGLRESTGNCVAVMDVDLQDPPELLIEMIAGVRDGADAVVARRTSRDSEPWLRSKFSDFFYYMINKISDTPLQSGVRDYRVMTRKMTDAVLSLTEYNRFSKGIFSWVGFNQKVIDYKYVERQGGRTSWSFWKLVKYAISGIVDFSEAPLLWVSGVGMFAFGLSIIGALFIVGRALVNPATAAFGWPSLVVILLGVSGVQLLSIGVVGRYISGVFMEVKNRPVYIVKDQQ